MSDIKVWHINGDGLLQCPCSSDLFIRYGEQTDYVSASATYRMQWTGTYGVTYDEFQEHDCDYGDRVGDVDIDDTNESAVDGYDFKDGDVLTCQQCDRKFDLHFKNSIPNVDDLTEEEYDELSEREEQHDYLRDPKARPSASFVDAPPAVALPTGPGIPPGPVKTSPNKEGSVMQPADPPANSVAVQDIKVGQIYLNAFGEQVHVAEKIPIGNGQVKIVNGNGGPAEVLNLDTRVKLPA